MIETQIYLRTVVETMGYLGIQVHEVITYREFIVWIRESLGQGTGQQIHPGTAHTNIIRGLAFPDRSLKLHTGIEQSDAIGTMKLIHVSIGSTHIHHRRQSSTISCRKAALVEIHVFHHIGIETGEKSQRMIRIIKRSTIYQIKVLITIATMHIESACQLLSFCHSTHTLQGLHHIRRRHQGKLCLDILVRKGALAGLCGQKRRVQIAIYHHLRQFTINTECHIMMHIFREIQLLYLVGIAHIRKAKLMLAFGQGKRKETIFIGGCTDAIRQIIDGGINQRFATLITDISAESVATLNLLNFVIDIRVRC